MRLLICSRKILFFLGLGSSQLVGRVRGLRETYLWWNYVSFLGSNVKDGSYWFANSIRKVVGNDLKTRIWQDA